MSQRMPNDFSPFQASSPSPAPSRGKAGLIAIAVTLVTLCALAAVLNETAFRIKQVAVVGNAYRTWQEIIDLAGIDGRQTYFTVSEQQIADGINSDRYLRFDKMEKHFPNGLTIYVTERRPVCSVQEGSATYLLAADGMVLNRVNDMVTYEGIIQVTGLKPKDMRLGAVMVAGTAERQQAYLDIVSEIILQGFQDQVSELNLMDSDSLKLVTWDGYTARLGDGTELRAKIGTLRGVIAKLREMGETKGVIEASIPGEATYMPPSP